jgi:hypothetical protein
MHLRDLREFQIPKMDTELQSECDSYRMRATRMLQKVEGCVGSKPIGGSGHPQSRLSNKDD